MTENKAAVRVLAARPDVNLRREVQFLLLAADQGTRLYWARVKGGEPDDE